MSISKTVLALLFSFLLFSSPNEGFAQKPLESSSLPFSLCWQNQTGNLNAQLAASDNASRFYISTNDGSIEAFDLPTGNKLWRSDMGNQNILEVSVISKSINILSEEKEIDKILNVTVKKSDEEVGRKFISTVISSETGLIISQKKDGETDKRNIYADRNKTNIERLLSEVISNKLIVIADGKGGIQLVNSDSKKKIWSTKVGAKVSSLTYLKGELQKIAATSLDNFVYMISVKNGQKIWKKRLPGRITVNPLIDKKQLIIVVAGEAAAFVLDIETGRQIGRIGIKGDGYLIRPLLRVADKYLFQTNEGLALFSQNDCSK